MRVIAGTARRINLKTPDGLDTRPTQDRIKETLLIFYSLILRGRMYWIFLREAVLWG